MWQMRFASAGTRDLTRLQESYRRLNHLNELAQIARPYFQQQIDLAANQVTETQNRLLNQIDPFEDPALTRGRLESFQQREQLYHRGLRSLEQAERLVLRWKESLDLDRRSLPFTERVRDLFTGVSTFTAGLWNFELFVVEDTIQVDGQPITGRRAVTVGKIVLAIVILVAGYFVSRMAARLVERLAVRRLKIEGNQASLIRRWVMVVLVLGLVVFSLVSVKIPLTIFAFAGGALAIGVGFGTQNLLKNFISGIILLFERPFRVGDVLDLGGQRGTLTSIGIRSSVIQLWDNTETIIPNSALLENNVTNWTYSNQAVRFIVTVGVAYGSDTRRVAQLLADVAERHGLVRKEPKPQVLFTDFADSALTFELRYWVDILRSNAAQVASDLRHMIGSAFTEAGVVIAFPQRDLHLDSLRPLQVQVLPVPEAKPSLPPPENAGGETAPG
jgi:small-conductance mechanosensitive channel